MKPMKLLRWFAINGAMAALMWFGFGPERVDGARYLYYFVLGFATFMVTFIAFNDELLKKARELGRPVPPWMCAGYDVACIVFLVWLGHWGLGLAILWQILCLAHIYNDETKKEAAA